MSKHGEQDMSKHKGSQELTGRERLIALAYLSRVTPGTGRYHPVHAARIYRRHGETIERVREVVRDKHRQDMRDMWSRITQENRT